VCLAAKSLGFLTWHQRCFQGSLIMSPFRKLLLVGVGALALHGVVACSTQTELNPQPLPPQGGESTGDPTQSPGDKNGGDTSGGGTGAQPPPSAADAGAMDSGTEGGDAADGGDG
jgi:hypothetical protein